MTHEENRAPAILASTGTVAEEGEEDSDDEILNNPDKFRDESLGTLPAVRVRHDDILLLLASDVIVILTQSFRRPSSALSKTSSTVTGTFWRGTSSSRS